MRSSAQVVCSTPMVMCMELSLAVPAACIIPRGM